MSTSILIIGASGRLGLALIRAASKQPSKPTVHAFARTPKKIPESETRLCTTVQKGDALDAKSITEALKETKADTVIVAIGVPNSVAPSELREKSAKALVEAMKPYPDVRLVCVSSIGAGGTDIKVGFGIGALIKWRLRHILNDHDKQEETFCGGLEKSKLWIVRPTGLTDGKPKGAVVMFGDHEKCPTANADREEVAGFIMQEICGDGAHFGQAVNITSIEKDNNKYGEKAIAIPK